MKAWPISLAIGHPFRWVDAAQFAPHFLAGVRRSTLNGADAGTADGFRFLSLTVRPHVVRLLMQVDDGREEMVGQRPFGVFAELRPRDRVAGWEVLQPADDLTGGDPSGDEVFDAGLVVVAKVGLDGPRVLVDQLTEARNSPGSSPECLNQLFANAS